MNQLWGTVDWLWMTVSELYRGGPKCGTVATVQHCIGLASDQGFCWCWTHAHTIITQQHCHFMLNDTTSLYSYPYYPCPGWDLLTCLSPLVINPHPYVYPPAHLGLDACKHEHAWRPVVRVHHACTHLLVCTLTCPPALTLPGAPVDTHLAYEQCNFFAVDPHPGFMCWFPPLLSCWK